jgi:hypothetical protein
VVGDAGCQVGKVAAGQVPLERLGDLVVVVLEGVEASDDGLQRGEVVRGQDLALDDREDDLDLIGPGRVERQTHQHEVGPLLLQAVGRDAVTVGPVVDDPEHAPRARRARRSRLLDEAPERHDPPLLLAAADRAALVDVPSGQAAQRAAAVVVVHDAPRPPRRR